MFNGAQHFQVLATEGFSGVDACFECSSLFAIYALNASEHTCKRTIGLWQTSILADKQPSSTSQETLQRKRVSILELAVRLSRLLAFYRSRRMGKIW